MSPVNHAPRIRLLRRTVTASAAGGVSLLVAAWAIGALGTFYTPGKPAITGAVFLFALTLGVILINIAIFAGMFLLARKSMARTPLGRVTHCPACGYDLAGIESAKCPECGDRLPHADANA